MNETLDEFPPKCLGGNPAQLILCACESGCTFPTHLGQPEYFRPIFGEENDVSKDFQLPNFSNFLLPCVTTFQGPG